MIKTDQFIRIPITLEIYDRAAKGGNVLKENNGLKTKDLSPRKEFAGTFGELAFRQYLLQIGLVENRNFSYDEVISGKYGDRYDFKLLPSDKTIDCKTQISTIPPTSDFKAHILAEDIDKTVDYYVFIWMLRDESGLILTGYITREKYIELATFHNKGEKLTTKFTVREDCYMVDCTELDTIENLPEIKEMLKKIK